jgi:hypothetical protein
MGSLIEEIRPVGKGAVDKKPVRQWRPEDHNRPHGDFLTQVKGRGYDFRVFLLERTEVGSNFHPARFKHGRWPVT